MDPGKDDGDSEPSYFGLIRRSGRSAAAPTTSTTVTPATPTTEQPPGVNANANTNANAPSPLPLPSPSPSSQLPFPSLPGSPLVHARTAQDARMQLRPLDRRQSAIRLRRLRDPLPSKLNLASAINNPPHAAGPDHDASVSGRRRSSSEPQRPTIIVPRDAATAGPTNPLSSVPELVSTSAACVDPAADPTDPTNPQRGRLHRLLGRRRQTATGPPTEPHVPNDDCYDPRIVDFLDVIDPEVATLSSITNVQNSLFVPSLGRWVNRQPTYNLSQLPPMPGAFPQSAEDVGKGKDAEEVRPGVIRSPSLSSVLSEPQYAILPNDATLEGWREEDIKLLNDYVRHMLHSRRSKMKQRLKAFGQYASNPLGFFVTLYATLITLFGLAWVLFLIGWIYVGEKQLYAIDVIDLVLVALFNLVGLGLAPFRAVDTYNMAYVAHYHRKTWKMREKLLLPDLKDHNDLPTGEASGTSPDVEAAPQRQEGNEFYPVLSDKEQEILLRHQRRLEKSHTFYKPHETQTHHAFPLRLLVAVVLLLDLHSCLQFALGICTYGVSRESRSAAATTSILCFSIATNATAGILISIGDRRTRKKDVLERLLKQDLTAEVMGKIQKKKQKEEEKKTAEIEGKDDKGLFGIGVPLMEKIRKSSDRGSEANDRKDQNQGGPKSGTTE